MRQLTFIFMLAVAFVGLTSTTCADRVKNPGRPIPADTSTNPGPTKDVGHLRVTASKYGPATGTNNLSNAQVSLYLTYANAIAGTPALVRQNTASDGSGATIFDWDPGQYYIVATWNDAGGVPHTSDTTHVKGYLAGPPPNSQANGPQLVTISKDITTNVNAILDFRE